MKKIDILIELIDVQNLKYLQTSKQKYEDAAKLRDRERELTAVYEKQYGILEKNTNGYTPNISQLYGLLREERINEILDIY